MIVDKINIFNAYINLYKPDTYNKDSNLISILVGKNSSGKSTALAEIINKILEAHEIPFIEKQLSRSYSIWEKEHRATIRQHYNSFEVSGMISRRYQLAEKILALIEDDFSVISPALSNVIECWQEYEFRKENIQSMRIFSETHKLPKIIAISNTVYNRFPETNDTSIYFKVCPSKRRFNRVTNYRLDTQPDLHKLLLNCFEIFGIKLEIQTPVYEDFNSIWDYFLRKLSKNSRLLAGFESILDFLGCKHNNTLFSMEITRDLIKFGANNNVGNLLKHIKRQLASSGVMRKLDYDIHLYISDIHYILSLFDNNSLELSLNEILSNSRLSQALSLAIEIGLITTTEVYFPRKNSEQDFHTDRIIGDLSSGEMSFLTLGILLISSVENNTTICIDEPEINLHPEWQERLLKFFEMLLQDYDDIHLVIATHSPQIVSNLPKKNAFIVNLTTKETLSSNDFINKSADFQLTEIFQAPGHNNEYLLRKLLILLEKLNHTHNTPLQDEDFRFLQNLKNLQIHGVFNQDDKVVIILNAILDILKQFGSKK